MSYYPPQNIPGQYVQAAGDLALPSFSLWSFVAGAAVGWYAMGHLALRIVHRKRPRRSRR